MTFWISLPTGSSKYIADPAAATNVKQLVGRPLRYRLRHGDWRALFWIEGDVATVVEVKHRKGGVPMSDANGLAAENAALKAENAQLRAEIEKLREDVEDYADALEIADAQIAALRSGEPPARIPIEVANLRAENDWTTLKAWRKYRGLTLDELAAACGVSKGHLSEVERGKKGLTQKLRAALATALDVHPQALWDDDDAVAAAAE